MRTYTEADANSMSWAEYGAAVQALLKKILASHQTFDAIAPILRSGGIPGNLLAIRLQITNLIPLQFKYRSHPSRMEELNPLPPTRIPAHPNNILICENNTSSGTTARAAIAHLKKMFPAARLHYATVAKVFGGPDSFAGVENYFFGVHTNERFLASPAQMKVLSLRPGIAIFPWEIIEHELREMNNGEPNSTNP
jgi:hypoxanthine phosphoribosyltransferase